MCGPSGEVPAAEQLLMVTQHVIDGAVVVRVRGEVDAMTAPRLWEALEGALRTEAARRVVVDLLEVSLLSSAGLTALVRAAELARERREPLRVVVDHHRPVVRPMQVTGVGDLLCLCHSVADALVV